LDTLISPIDTLIYTYDGSLPKSVRWKGEVNGFVSVEYDSNYQVTSQSVNGGNIINFTYDNDGLLMQSGSMSIAREPAAGRINGTTLGNVTTSQSYNSLGELSGYQANYSGNPIFQTSYQRDSLGRITQINEIVEGSNTKKNYAYDIAGRLWKVWRNDTLISTYTYDPNGNRITHITPTSADSGAYDSQDRMISYGNAQYIYSKNGELQKKIEGTDTTSYTYDYFGNLTKVIMPNGDRIDYIIDGQNRRIGKKLNGQIVKRWIYSGQLSPVAELDSAGNVIARFAGGYMVKGGNTYQLVRDHLGSVRMVVDVTTGTIAQKLEFDEYGNIITDINPDFQPFAYAGGLYETQTKLVRFGARDYDVGPGRWTSKEPIGFLGSNNFYTYGFNEPVNSSDKNGLLVEVYYEPIRGLDPGRLAASLYGASHSFIRVKTSDYDAMIEMIGGGELVVKPFDQNRANKADKRNVKRPCPDNDYSFEESIIKDFFDFFDNPQMLPEYANDPEVRWIEMQVPGGSPIIVPFVVGGNYNNSNTFANYLIQHAGGYIENIPSSAYGSNSKFK